MLAEDLNVAFPLTDWVREAFVTPVAQRDGVVPGPRRRTRSRSTPPT